VRSNYVTVIVKSCTWDTRGGKLGHSPAALALVGRLSIDDFELNLAMVPRSYGAKDDAERLSGVALPAYHATQVLLCHPQLKN
jgi:hypothetical protein